MKSGACLEIAFERIIPGYVCYPLFASLFLFTELSLLIGCCNSNISIHRYGGGMSSAKAALESDTRVSLHFFSTYQKNVKKFAFLFCLCISNYNLPHFLVCFGSG
jgi:hypothetical protein